MSFTETLTQHLDAGALGFWVHTYEEQRVLEDIKLLAHKRGAIPMQWTPTRGLTSLIDPTREMCTDARFGSVMKFLNDGAWETQNKKAWVLALPDAHLVLEKGNTRYAKDTIFFRKGVIIGISPKKEVPPELERQVTAIPFTLPTQEELAEFIENQLEFNKEQSILLASTAAGLTIYEALVVIGIAIQKHGRKKDAIQSLVQFVWEQKAKSFDTKGLIKIKAPEDRWDEIGGMYHLKRYTERIAPLIINPQKLSPNGILLTGFQGTGKSLYSRGLVDLLSQISGRQWKYIEWGNVYNPYVGVTEQHTEEQIELTELHRPCVVRIDEIAHEYAGHASSGMSDAGVTSRKIGKHLTWLEERKPGIFVVACTNQPWDLPAHMARQGRLNCGTWYIPIPKEDAITDILRIHLLKNFPKLIDSPLDGAIRLMESRHFTGDEVEQSVLEAGRMTYPKPPDMKDVIEAAERVIPMFNMRRDDFNRLETWAITERRAREAA